MKVLPFQQLVLSRYKVSTCDLKGASGSQQPASREAVSQAGVRSHAPLVTASSTCSGRDFINLTSACQQQIISCIPLWECRIMLQASPITREAHQCLTEAISTIHGAFLAFPPYDRIFLTHRWVFLVFLVGTGES